MHSPQEQLRALRGVLARRPDHVLAHLNIGNVHFEADRYNDALTWCLIVLSCACDPLPSVTSPTHLSFSCYVPLNCTYTPLICESLYSLLCAYITGTSEPAMLP